MSAVKMLHFLQLFYNVHAKHGKKNMLYNLLVFECMCLMEKKHQTRQTKGAILNADSRSLI